MVLFYRSKVKKVTKGSKESLDNQVEKVVTDRQVLLDLLGLPD